MGRWSGGTHIVAVNIRRVPSPVVAAAEILREHLERVDIAVEGEVLRAAPAAWHPEPTAWHTASSSPEPTPHRAFLGSSAAVLEPVFAVLVVELALLGVGQHVVRLGHRL